MRFGGLVAEEGLYASVKSQLMSFGSGEAGGPSMFAMLFMDVCVCLCVLRRKLVRGGR